jgi:2-aminoadipate transaminase
MLHALCSMSSAKGVLMSEELKPILFTRGNPAEEALPLADISECAHSVFQREGKILFQYGHYSGYRPLREWIAGRYGVKVDQVLLGNGSMEFLPLRDPSWSITEIPFILKARAMTGPSRR